MIKRSKHTTDYTVIPNAIMEDKDLSCECLGMLTYLIGKPSNWKIQAEFLGKRFGWGKTKVYTILKKLIDAGYVTRKANIVKGLKRGSEYTVYDTKLAEKPHCPQTRTSDTPIVRESGRIISNNNLSYIYKEKIYKKEKEYEKEFQEFKLEYPRSNNRSTWIGGTKIYEKFKKVLKGGVSFDDLMKGLRLYKQDQTVKDGYAKNVLTWLNQEGWTYEPPQAEQVIPFSIKQDDDFILKQWNESDEWFRGRLKRNHDFALRSLLAEGKIIQEEYDNA
tara:strand:+ start:6510 stop:7337 length:828 start_codon:yes stop_codon:yes gene_type:complete